MSSTETMRSWPKHIRDITEVPWEFKDAFMYTFDYGHEFPYCIYIPAEWVWREPARMLCMTEDSFTVFEDCGNRNRPAVYPLKDIQRMEHGQILLSSWVEIGGMAGGRPSTHRLTFNTVREELFKPFFKRFRRLHTPENARDNGSPDAEFRSLRKTSYKFYNYGLDALLEGETADEVVFQSGIRVRPVQKLPLKKTLSNDTLFIRTDTELILLREQSVKHATSKYGVITDYIPLSAIQKAWTGQSRYAGVAEWTVELKNGEQLKIHIQEENRARIASIVPGTLRAVPNAGLYGTYH